MGRIITTSPCLKSDGVQQQAEKAIKVRLDEQWFWTSEWQKKETEADKAMRAGKIKGPFSDHKKLITALKSKK